MTSMFMHADWEHLIGNLMLLYLMGVVVECFWTGWAFTGLYLLSGIAGALAHHLTNAQSASPLVGASGAIAGVMAAFLLGHGRSSVRVSYVLFLIWIFRVGNVRVPAVWLIGLWVAVQVWNAWGGTRDGVAYGAHVGGFLAGLGATFVARKYRWIATDAGFERA